MRGVLLGLSLGCLGGVVLAEPAELLGVTTLKSIESPPFMISAELVALGGIVACFGSVAILRSLFSTEERQLTHALNSSAFPSAIVSAEMCQPPNHHGRNDRPPAPSARRIGTAGKVAWLAGTHGKVGGRREGEGQTGKIKRTEGKGRPEGKAQEDEECARQAGRRGWSGATRDHSRTPQ